MSPGEASWNSKSHATAPLGSPKDPRVGRWVPKKDWTLADGPRRSDSRGTGGNVAGRGDSAHRGKAWTAGRGLDFKLTCPASGMAEQTGGTVPQSQSDPSVGHRVSQADGIMANTGVGCDTGSPW